MRVLREVAPYLSLGTTLAVTVAVAVATGFWLDSRLGTGPVATALCGFLGAGAALFHFVRSASRLSSGSKS
jgi:F0F1-type ATP synthase assembly protein I